MRIIDDSELFRPKFRELPDGSLEVIDYPEKSKAEREYERDDAGRFGSGSGPARKPEAEGGEGARPAAGSRLRDPAPAVAQAITRAEEANRMKPLENATVVGPDGNTIVEREGDESSVTIQAAELNRMEGATFTHNHPRASSFSPDDVYLASRAGLAEMRATGPDGSTFRIQSSRGNVWPVRLDIETSFTRAFGEVRSELSARVKAGEITARQANLTGCHEIWTRIAPELGLIYERTGPGR